uniref:Uncharacterized protein n=1 Tax=candidate division CPR3 bacterium TaxID=2268181 RepID=A0A7C4M0K1_UNCC3
MQKRYCLDNSETEKIDQIIDDFFHQIREIILIKIDKSPNFEIKSYTFPRSDEKIEALLYRGQPVANVTIAKDEQGRTNLTLFKNIDDLRKTRISNYSP